MTRAEYSATRVSNILLMIQSGTRIRGMSVGVTVMQGSFVLPTRH